MSTSNGTQHTFAGAPFPCSAVARAAAKLAERPEPAATPSEPELAKATLANLNERLAKQDERLWFEREKRRSDAWSEVLKRIEQLRGR